MTREEAIEILSRPKSMKGVPDEILTAHAMAIQALELEQRILDNGYTRKAFEALEGKDINVPIKWIPCSESLPLTEYGESDRVLATCGYRDVEDTSIRWINTLYFNGGCWCYPTGETYTQKVYAWTPLPEPWEGEENGKIN